VPADTHPMPHLRQGEHESPLVARSPHRAGPDGFVHVPVRVRPAAPQPGDVRLDIGLDTARDTAQAILLRREHVEQLPPPGELGA